MKQKSTSKRKANGQQGAMLILLNNKVNSSKNDIYRSRFITEYA